MTGSTDHISRDELIDLANDALAEARVDAVLDHIAECDQCASASSRIHKTALFWDNWQDHLTNFAQAPSASMAARADWWRARLAEVLTRISAAPAGLAAAALEVVLSAGREGRILVESAAACMPPNSMDFVYSAPAVTTRAAGAQEPDQDQGTFQTSYVKGQVALDVLRQRVSISLLDSGARPRVLLIPFDAQAAPILHSSQETIDDLYTIEFHDVPLGKFLVAILPPEAGPEESTL